MTTKIENVEHFDRNAVYVTDYIKVFYNYDKKYGESLSLRINGTPLERFINMVEEETACEISKASKKDKESKYIKFKLDKEILYVNEHNEELEEKDELKIYSKNDVKLIFIIRPYVYKGTEGLTLKVKQVKCKPTENKFEKNLFTD